MIVTATEFKTNFGKYLDMLTKEDIFITRNGKTIAKVINPQVSAVDSLRGMLKNVPSDIDLDSLREERLSKYEDHVIPTSFLTFCWNGSLSLKIPTRS